MAVVGYAMGLALCGVCLLDARFTFMYDLLLDWPIASLCIPTLLLYLA